jgi:carbonic anhydrase
MTTQETLSAEAALARLRTGNRRFVTAASGRDLDWEHVRRIDLQRDQRPFAIVLGCSDSRVPLEMIFDQGLGDLFVVRVAGNVAAPTQIGSIEFAALRFDTPLVVVLGHSSCGAVTAAVDGLFTREGSDSPHLGEVVRRIQPVVETVRDAHPHLDRGELLAASVRENARSTAALLTRESSLLEGRVADGRLRIVAAEYALESGEVCFFEG